MSFVAPNLSKVVGTTVAAKLMGKGWSLIHLMACHCIGMGVSVGVAGGLTALSKIPACNVLVRTHQSNSCNLYEVTFNL